MQIVIVRDNIVENIGSPPLNGPPPAGTTAHEFNGFVSIGWEWNDGEPADPDPAPPPGVFVPKIVTAGAFIRAAHELDWLDGIEAAVATAGQQNSLIPLLWARSSQFERPHPFVGLIAQLMGKTSGEVDDLFILAGSYDR